MGREEVVELQVKGIARVFSVESEIPEIRTDNGQVLRSCRNEGSDPGSLDVTTIRRHSGIFSLAV